MNGFLRMKPRCLPDLLSGKRLYREKRMRWEPTDSPHQGNNLRLEYAEHHIPDVR